MNLFQKIANSFSVKATNVGGFEILTRMQSGAWSKTKMLEQYEKSLYVYRCASKIAEKTSSIVPHLYQIINSAGDTKELINHPLLNLIYKPNPFQTRMKFLSILVINLKLAGDAFVYKVRNNSGQVVELWNLRPDMVTVVKSSTEFIAGYEFVKPDGSTLKIDQRDIIHFKKPTPLDEYYGVSPVRAAQTRIDIEAHASDYQRNFFLNNARPDAAIKTEGTLTDEQKSDIRKVWNKRHRGSHNAGKIAIFEGGIEYQQLSLSQRDMDYIEGMKFTRDDILVAFAVPKSVVAITDDVNRANAEAGLSVFLSETIYPEALDLWDTINEDLVVPDFGKNLFIEVPDPTPANREQIVKEYESGLTQGWLLINEVRAKENLQPIDGGWSLYKPLTSQPVGGLTKAQKSLKRDEFFDKLAKADNDRKLKIFRGREELRLRFVIADEIKAQFKKEVKKFKKDVEKDSKKEKEKVGFVQGDTLREKYAIMVLKKMDKNAATFKKDVINLAEKQKSDFLSLIKKVDFSKSKEIGSNAKKKIDKFFAEQEGVWADFSLPFLTEFAMEAASDAMDIVAPDVAFQISQRIKNSLEVRAKEFGLNVNKTTREKITAAINEGIDAGEGMAQISDRVSTVYEGFSTYRADLIARTETTAANNEGTLEAYKQSKVATHKEWIATMDARTREAHAAIDGEIVPVNDNFSNGLPYPQEPNCRCVIAPAFSND